MQSGLLGIAASIRVTIILRRKFFSLFLLIFQKVIRCSTKSSLFIFETICTQSGTQSIRYYYFDECHYYS